jgi:hypothetical protein
MFQKPTLRSRAALRLQAAASVAAASAAARSFAAEARACFSCCAASRAASAHVGDDEMGRQSGCRRNGFVSQSICGVGTAVFVVRTDEVPRLVRGGAAAAQCRRQGRQGLRLRCLCRPAGAILLRQPAGDRV